MVLVIYLILSVFLCLVVGFTSGQLTNTTSEWFLNLTKPSIFPPTYLFGIVWTILYIMMGVSLYLIILKAIENSKKKSKKKQNYKLPFILFGSQLILNFFWTLIFFGLKNMVFALIEIIVLLGILIYMGIIFRKYSKWAFYLLIPYILWVSFATILTFSFILVN
jgi:benzodiazapine receptor